MTGLSYGELAGSWRKRSIGRGQTRRRWRAAPLYITYNRASAGDQRGRYYRDKRQGYPPDCERDAAKQYVFRV